MPTRILFIEGPPATSLPATARIRRVGIELEHRVVEARAGLLDALNDGPWSAIVARESLPHWSGLDALQLVRGRDADVPFILVCDAITEERAIEAMRAGANDYVLEDNLARLEPALLRELRNAATRVERNALLATAEGIFAVDLEGRCTLVNRAATQIFGRRDEELIGARIQDLIAGTGSPIDFAEIIRTGEVMIRRDQTFAHEDGSLIPVDYSAAPIVDHGRIAGVVVTFSDITQRRRMEAKIEQANRVAGLGRLAATVAHEFNNVLMGISPFVEVIRRQISPERVAIALDHITSAIQRGKRVTTEILRFTQPEQPARATVDVESLLRSLAAEARDSMGNRLEVEVVLGGGDLRIDGDSSQLHQVLRNVIGNARDAMPVGGHLTLAARLDEPDSRFVHLSISDTGTGMSAETSAHVFEPLFTTKRKGLGLGLSVVHQVVMRHDGDVTIDSEPGKGTTVHLYLPIAAAPRAVVSNERVQPLRAPRAHVLIVEDDPSVSLGIASLLQLENMTVEVVDTGAAAIDAARARKPDVVVLDIHLPDMDGRAVHDAIEAIHPHMPVVFSTGHGDRTRFEDLLSRPIARFLLKPYDSATLLSAIHAITSE